MSYNCKNYFKQGGDEFVIDGKLTIGENAVIEGELPIDGDLNVTGTLTIANDATVEDEGGVLAAAVEDGLSFGPAEDVEDSTATEVVELVTDFNGLLAKLRTAGLLVEASAEG